MTDFGWDYPPGVTGNEYAIAGPDYEKESDIPCSVCGKPTTEFGYGDQRWLTCVEFDHITNLELFDEGPDPDRAYDEKRDRQMVEEERFSPDECSDWGHPGEELEGEPR